MARLEGRVALVTGAAAGLGRATAELFASEGAAVVVADRDDASATAEVIAAAGGQAEAVRVDATDETSVAAMVDAALTAFGGGLDVLATFAGVSLAADGGATDTDVDTWEATMAVNVRGVWLSCKHALAPMIDGGGGAIVNVASFVAHMGAATPQLAYTSSKGAVVAMTREIAVIHARQGVRANALCPGPVLTPLLAKYLPTEADRQRRLVHVPMGRFGEGAEIARAALFLASDDSSFMTGQSLIVDGGITAAYTTPDSGER